MQIWKVVITWHSDVLNGKTLDRQRTISRTLLPQSLHSPYTLPHFNLSLQTSQIPDDWRRAIVTPVAKTPRTADPNLFRPISVTSVVCKALEAILKD